MGNASFVLLYHVWVVILYSMLINYSSLRGGIIASSFAFCLFHTAAAKYFCHFWGKI